LQLKQRIITAAIAIPAIVLIILYANTLVFSALLTGFICLGAWEWAGLCGWSAKSAKFIYSLILFFLLIACFILRNSIVSVLVILLAGIAWLVLTTVIMVQQKRSSLAMGTRYTRALLGIVILVPAWLSLVLLHNSHHFGAGYVLYLFALVWLADSAAYFAGHHWGRTKLASIISPGKTWEGFAGAMLLSAVMGVAFALATRLQVPDILIFSIICMITVAGSVVGDLTESLMKRLVNVKDSGNVFPGHGGVLDRIDSLTAAAPIFLLGLWLELMVR